MVQKKVSNANHKLGIQANILIKSERHQPMIKPSIQNHDGKSKVADLKAIKMKKSRSTKRSNLEFSLHSSQQPAGSPLPHVTPTQTPSPKKPLVQCKSPYTSSSPNYMKSTSSSEARKEKTTSNNISSTTSKLHKVAKTLTKTSSSLKKMRAVTNAPSFKHTRSFGACKKVVLCHGDVDVQKATCSSTIKDSKFPAYLKLKDGATEAEGNSVFKVCPYSYCSLNGHHHMSAPPLKRFLSSRRKLLRSLKCKPDGLPPSKAIITSSECNEAEEKGGMNNDMFIEVYVTDRQAAAQVSESLSNEPCSENEFQDEYDHVEVNSVLGMSFSLEDEGYIQTPIEKQTSFESLCVSLDYAFGENSDIEWEEGQSIAMFDESESFAQTVYSKNKDKPVFESNNSDDRITEFLAEEYPPYFHDEIVECLCFSDTDSSTDNESTHTGDDQTDDMYSERSNEMTENFSSAKKEDESNGKQGGIYYDTLEGITGPQSEDVVSNQDKNELDKGGESSEGKYMVEEKDGAESVMEEGEPSDGMSKYITTITRDLETCLANIDDQTETDHNASGVEAENCVHRRSTTYYGKEEDSSKVSFHFKETSDTTVKTSRIEDFHKINEADDVSPTNGNNKQEAIKCDSRKMKSLLRCRKADEATDEEKEFNPREPNFLEAEPEPESEKVDLRHKEMDDRRNAEEWMLDYALQKTVSQLAPARKKKVALLIEAFESVLPIPKCESTRRRSPPRFAYARTLQACS